MTETNTDDRALQEADLANMDTRAAASLRSMKAKMEARAQQGAEKWEIISPPLRARIGEGNFERWFKDVKPTLTANGQQPPRLRLSFPTGFICKEVEARWGDLVRFFWQNIEPDGTLEIAIQTAEEPPPTRRETLPAKASRKPGKDLPFPAYPTEARPVVNEIARSALFAAIQGKDRRWLKDEVICSSGDTVMMFTGEQLNQDDHDVLMQLVACAAGYAPGEYIPVSGHSLLKALGRKTDGREYKRLYAEIKRLVAGLVELKNPRCAYLGHLVDDAKIDEKNMGLAFRLNENLSPLYEGYNYTLIDWERRKRLKGKDQARWLQLELATHAPPYKRNVEYYRKHSGSKAKSLFHYRADLRRNLDALKANGDIAGWTIDPKSDLVDVDREKAVTASQQRHLIGKITKS